METTGGAMHDGSKRLRETEEWDAISYESSTEGFMDCLSESSAADKQEPIVFRDEKLKGSKKNCPACLTSSHTSSGCPNMAHPAGVASKILLSI